MEKDILYQVAIYTYRFEMYVDNTLPWSWEQTCKCGTVAGVTPWGNTCGELPYLPRICLPRLHDIL